MKTPDGKVLRIADLVDDDQAKRDKVSAALRNPSQKNNRDHVDIIIALGMAKEGFDWIWCEHALTIGYRASLTEIIQIIGRATRDAEGKAEAKFTNLIAEPDASQDAVTDAVNDTLKAIAASLLMEQVLAPKFDFRPKNDNNVPTEGFDYGEDGYATESANVGYNPATGQVQLEIAGLFEPKSAEAKRICAEDINEVVAAVAQDTKTVEQGLLNKELPAQEITQVQIGHIVKERYPDLDDHDREAVRQRCVAAYVVTQQAKAALSLDEPDTSTIVGEIETSPNTAFIDGVRKFAMDVRNLDVDFIDQINPFSTAYAIMAKTMSEESLRGFAAYIAGKRINMTEDEAKTLATRAIKFKEERGRLPSITSADPWEKRMAEGIEFIRQTVAKGQS